MKAENGCWYWNFTNVGGLWGRREKYYSNLWKIKNDPPRRFTLIYHSRTWLYERWWVFLSIVYVITQIRPKMNVTAPQRLLLGVPANIPP